MTEPRFDELIHAPARLSVAPLARASVRLNRVGRAAFERHVAALQEIVTRAGASVIPGRLP